MTNKQPTEERIKAEMKWITSFFSNGEITEKGLRACAIEIIKALPKKKRWIL